MRVVLLAVACSLVPAPAAHAATAFVGHTTDAEPDGSGVLLFEDGTAVQEDTVAPLSYVVPFTGVVTAWRTYADATGTAKLRVFRSGSAVAESPQQNIAAGLNGLFIPAGSAVAVQQGDAIGITTSGFRNVYGPDLVPGDGSARRWDGEPSGGGTATAGALVNVGALVETDADGDRQGDDSQDADDDNDGAADTQDAFPLNPAETRDSDRDGTGDNADADDDGDGAPDAQDAFPLDPKERRDSDRDGIGDNADPDDDNDGFPDVADAFPLDGTRSVAAGGGVSLSRRTVTMDSRRGRVTLRVSCAAGTPGGCRGTVSLATAGRVEVAARRRLRLGSARFRAAAGSSASVRLKLSRTGQRTLRKLRRLSVKATARVGGQSVSSRFVLRAPR